MPIISRATGSPIAGALAANGEGNLHRSFLIESVLMNNKILKAYMLEFPGSFIGFFEVLADVLATLGFEWTEANNSEWGTVFINGSEQCAKIAVALSKIHDEFEAKKVANV
jgi:hypothetical protein